MDPLATLLALASALGAADCREYRAAMRQWIRTGGYKVPVAELAGWVSLQRIAAWRRLGWVAP